MATIEELDADIDKLHARISQARVQYSNLASVLLSQPHLASRLSQSRHNKPPTTTLRAFELQSKRNLENVYRACAGVTAYKVQDPDPKAENNGNILGISIDIAVNGKFADTYHVLLSWVERDDIKILKIHKHTIPPCIPIQQLARKWLPTSAESPDAFPEQDLIKFGRNLRTELVSWRMRFDAVEALRKEAGLSKGRELQEQGTTLANTGKVLNAFIGDDDETSDAEEEEDENGPPRLVDIEANTAVREITLTWSDQRTAILDVAKDGRIEKAVFRTREGARDGSLSRKAAGPIKGLLRRLNA